MDDRICVLDFGIRAYCDRSPHRSFSKESPGHDESSSKLAVQADPSPADEVLK